MTDLEKLDEAIDRLERSKSGDFTAYPSGAVARYHEVKEDYELVLEAAQEYRRIAPKWEKLKEARTKATEGNWQSVRSVTNQRFDHSMFNNVSDADFITLAANLIGEE